jgi:hypothetical protein
VLGAGFGLEGEEKSEGEEGGAHGCERLRVQSVVRKGSGSERQGRTASLW